MPSLKVNSKYTYASGLDYLDVRVPPTSFASHNYCFDPMYGVSNYNVQFPAWALPTLGNGRNHRVKSQIKVTSLSLRMKLTTGTKNIFSYNWDVATLPVTIPSNWDQSATEGVTYDGGNTVTRYSAMPRIPHQWMKVRLMIIKWDDDIKMTPQLHNDWFYRVFCPFTRDFATPTNPDYQEGAELDYVPPPTELWADVKRMTTPWNGKFNILMDKKIMLRKGKEIDINFNMPWNRYYSFEENNEELISPNISCILFAPRNVLTDVDPVTGSVMINNDTPRTFRCCQCFWWAKLNFQEL